MADNYYLGQSTVQENEPSKIKSLADRLKGLGAGLAMMGGNYAPTQFMQKEEQQKLENEQNKQAREMKQRAEQRAIEEWGVDKQLKQAQLKKLTTKESGILTPKDAREIESKYRQELVPYTKQMNEVDTSYRKIKNISAKPSPAGDMSIIYNYMKMQDPGSTVRETEFANAERAKSWFDSVGVPNAVRLAYIKATKGEGLLPEQRVDFVNQAKNLYDSQYESYNNMVQPYKTLADQSGLNFENIALYKPVLKEIKQDKEPSLAKQAGKAVLDLAVPSAQASGLTSEDQQAINWARANSSNPKAQQILKLHGM